MPVKRYAEERIGPYVTASTPQERTLFLYAYKLSTGDVRDGAGVERQEAAARGGYPDIALPAPNTFRMLPVAWPISHSTASTTTRA